MPDRREEAAMSVAARITQKLTAAFQPARLEVIDDSHSHAGHAGAGPSGETHFNVVIVADAFAGKSRVDRQRLVYGVLADELAGPVHALSLTILTSAEAAART
jgi:BolA protein